MFNHSIAFDSPGYLLLLLLLPVMWWLSFAGLSGLGRWRRLMALTLRSLVLTTIVLALADIQYQQRNDKLAVIYLLDQSLSIPIDQRQEMVKYVNASISTHRDGTREDRYAVIVFGHDAAVEMPLVDVGIELQENVETILDPEYSDVATAIQRAEAMFPFDAAKRIVLVTDGNQNIGNAQREAQAAAAAGVSIDVVPVMLTPRNEIAVEKIDVPSTARKGQPFEMRVVLNNDAPEDSKRSVAGKLRIIRKTGEREEEIVTQSVTVPPGKRVFTISEKIDHADFYTYEAKFSPDNADNDGMTQNNVASAFSHVRGKGQVLLIENWSKRGDFDHLVDRLRGEDISVTVMPSDQLFTSLAELQKYDCVVLANVARSTGDDASNKVTSFSDDQVNMLVRNTREMGCGLIMLGGPDTYGAGGWTNSELEKAMPVDFEIKNTKIRPVGALVLMMHAGEMARSNYWQKRIAFESIKILGSSDYCGLIQWNGTEDWLWGKSKGGLIRVGPNRKMMLKLTDRMTIGDMPDFDAPLKLSAAGFARVPQTATKHMIIISDGDPTPASGAVLKRLKQLKVKISTVAVGSHGRIGSDEMRRIADATGGKYYEVKSAKALPKIYQRETRRIARPLVFEKKPAFQPSIVSQHEILQGVESGVPPISGFVLTTVKENPLVEVILKSPYPKQDKYATLLATWTYGAGKAVAFTSDAGNRWANQWTQWDGYDKMFSQMVRWAMRPTSDMGKYTVATNVRDGKTQVVITALDADEEFLNDQAMLGSVVAPDMGSIPLTIEQVAPGRYVGEFDSELAGSYLIVVNPGPGKAPLRTGVNVGYSTEYGDTETNMALLKSLAALPVKNGGPTGILVETGLDISTPESIVNANPFRRDLAPAISNQSIWPLLMVFGCCAFFADVFVRRVQINLDWLPPVYAKARDWVLRREREVAVPETMSRLQSRKQAINEQLDDRRAATRFEDPNADPNNTETDTPVVDATTDILAAATAKPTTPTKPKPKPETPDAAAGESYTERLLKAKRKVWEDRDDDGGKK